MTVLYPSEILALPVDLPKATSTDALMA